jgi:hypothetical protein
MALLVYIAENLEKCTTFDMVSCVLLGLMAYQALHTINPVLTQMYVASRIDNYKTNVKTLVSSAGRHAEAELASCSPVLRGVIKVFPTIVGAGILVLGVQQWRTRDARHLEQQASLTAVHAATVGKRKNIYWKPAKVAVRFPANLCTTSLPALARLVRANMFHFEMRHMGEKVTKVKKCQAFAICGQMYLLPAHSVLETPFELIIKSSQAATSSLSPQKAYMIGSDSVNINVANDLAVIAVVGGLCRKNLMKHMARNYDNALHDRRGNGMIVEPTSESGVIWTSRNDGRHSESAPPIKLAISKEVFIYNMQRDGLCGAIFILGKGPANMICGMHVGGDRVNDFGVSTSITTNILQPLMSFPHLLGRVDLNGANLIDTTDHQGFEPVIKKGTHINSMVHYVNGTAEVYGEIGGIPRHVSKSKVTGSIVQQAVAAIHEFKPYIGGIGPPEMRTGMYNGLWLNAMQTGLSQIVKSDVKIESDLVHIAVSNYKERVLAMVPMEEFTKLKPLSDRQAINGIQGSQYINSVNKTSGGGFGASGGKYKYMLPDPTEECPDHMKWIDSVQSQIEDMRESTGRGNVPTPIFTSHVKDEAVSRQPTTSDERQTMREHVSDSVGYEVDEAEAAERIGEDYFSKPKLARVFAGVPIAFGHLIRQLFLPIVDIVQTYNFAFECAVGVNAESADWGTFKQYLSQFDVARVIAGDYSKYDKMMPSILLINAFWILIYLMGLGQYTATEIMRAHCLAHASVNPMVLFDLVLIHFLNSLTSGHPLTVILNSIANSLLVRIAYLMAGFPIDKFNFLVALLTYGDDNTLNVDSAIDFTHDTMRIQFAKLGIKYTKADKTAGVELFRSIWDIDFLKRNMALAHVAEWEQQVVFAPLALKSIYKMLSFHTDTSLTEIEHAETNMVAASNALAQHGPEIYNSICEQLRAICISHNLRVHITSYSEQLARLRPYYEESSIVPTSMMLANPVSLSILTRTMWPLAVFSAFCEETAIYYFPGTALTIALLECEHACDPYLHFVLYMMRLLLPSYVAPFVHILFNFVSLGTKQIIFIPETPSAARYSFFGYNFPVDMSGLTFYMFFFYGAMTVRTSNDWMSIYIQWFNSFLYYIYVAEVRRWRSPQILGRIPDYLARYGRMVGDFIFGP